MTLPSHKQQLGVKYSIFPSVSQRLILTLRKHVFTCQAALWVFQRGCRQIYFTIEGNKTLQWAFTQLFSLPLWFITCEPKQRRQFCSLQLRCTYFLARLKILARNRAGKCRAPVCHLQITNRQTDGWHASLLGVNGPVVKILHLCRLQHSASKLFQALHCACKVRRTFSNRPMRASLLLVGVVEGTDSCLKEEVGKHQALDYLEGHQLLPLVFNNASAWWQSPLYHGPQFQKCAAKLFDIYCGIGK